MDRRPPDPLWRTVVGTVLRTERRLQGLTLREVGAVAGISVPYLSEIERGRKEASSEMLAAAAKALGLRLVDLLARAHDTLAEHEGRAVTSVMSVAGASTVTSVTSVTGLTSVTDAVGEVGAAPFSTRGVTACSLRLVA